MPSIKCPYCNKQLNKYYIDQHIARVHNLKTFYYPCTICKKRFQTIPDLFDHRSIHYSDFNLFEIYKHSLNHSAIIYRHICPKDSITIDQCFSTEIKNEVQNIILNELNQISMLKFSIIFAAEFAIIKNEQIEEIQWQPCVNITKPFSVITRFTIHFDVITLFGFCNQMNIKFLVIKTLSK